MANAFRSWRGPAQFATITLLMTIGAMWATRPPPACEMPLESHRHLDLTRVVDREHLATDISDSERIARRYIAHLSSAPPGVSPGPAAQPFTADQCVLRLHEQIMTGHEVAPAEFVAAIPRD
jgi:hypothetical protein